jgi:hypothetical protein
LKLPLKIWTRLFVWCDVSAGLTERCVRTCCRSLTSQPFLSGRDVDADSPARKIIIGDGPVDRPEDLCRIIKSSSLPVPGRGA